MWCSMFIIGPVPISLGFPEAQKVKNLPAMWEALGSIPGWGRPPGEGMVTHSSSFAGRLLWAEQPDRLQSMSPSVRTEQVTLSHSPPTSQPLELFSDTITLPFSYVAFYLSSVRLEEKR